MVSGNDGDNWTAAGSSKVPSTMTAIRWIAWARLMSGVVDSTFSFGFTFVVLPTVDTISNSILTLVPTPLNCKSALMEKSCGDCGDDKRE
jgi:hypothetical protein